MDLIEFTVMPKAFNDVFTLSRPTVFSTVLLIVTIINFGQLNDGDHDAYYSPFLFIKV